MNLAPVFFAPHPALSGYISHMMVVEARFDHASLQFSPFPPAPQHTINFYPRDAVTAHINNDIQKLPASVIIGPQVSRVNIAMGAHHVIVSVAFMPGGMHRLLKMPMHELYDEPFDATLLLGYEMAEVNEQLQAAQTAIEMKNVVERYMMKKLKHSNLLPWECAMKAQLQGHITIENSASLACLSLRQYERRTKEIMGYSPKIFSRLVRFSKAYRLKESRPSLSWTHIAYTCGYYDQMHLIKDFKEFAGVLPGTLAKQINKAPALLQEHMRI
ncbi:AraC family transcriptional regulator [Mucilaginibacter psychrotolerans]|uniref:AraC family transcriptional regulator n=1 Tax=Mucilaginibacter psychrotolerans TaxID=1524096 RepID=A0A4Y8SQW5_9SPHI|nr:helix-turn-helix domain-containing protein [Mucilaginibacter psychrotolerans]TFF40794.1 AraC family transcriptional regulator [Mucilaginibacter psychrotolerans]